MIIPSIRITLSAPFWLLSYGGAAPPVFKIRGNNFEFGLAELDSLYRTGGFFLLGHYCQIARFELATGHMDLVGQMRSGTQPYLDELLATSWQLCDEKVLAFYQLPQAADPPMPEPRHSWEPQIVGLPPTWPASPPLADKNPPTPPT